MSGLRPHLTGGGKPETHLVSTNMVGGTCVEPDGATGKVKPTIANSTTVIGVAIGDAAATAGAIAPTTDTWGRPVSGGLTPPNEVAVAYSGSWWLKNTSGSTIAYGADVFAGAAGIITGTGTGRKIGICIEPGGIVNNAEGRVRLTIR